MSISFGFKKKIENKVTGADKDDNDDVDYLKTVEDKQLKTNKTNEVKKELIIPLIKKNRYRNPNAAKSNKNSQNKKTNNDQEVVDEVEAAAVKEIIEESTNFLENMENKSEDTSFSVPLLMKNKVPDGFETDERLDVSLRPDEATDADYEQIPIEAFGMAVLRGMGWTAEEGIGKTFKQNTKPLEQRVRPKGLGLGAEVPKPITDNKSKKPEQVSNKDSDETLKIEKGSKVFIHSGSLKNKYAIVEGVDIESARFIVKLAIGGKVEQVGQHSLHAVSKREYEQNAKYLGKLKKDHSGTQIIGNGVHRKDEVSTQPVSKRKRDVRVREQDSDEEKNFKKSKKAGKKKHKKYDEREDNETRKHKNSKKNLQAQSWVRPQMKVRIIDRRYKKGKYYLQKVIIEDVLGGGKCCCKTEEGKILDDIEDSMLETVIPKSTSHAYIIIVRSSRGMQHDGKLARILEKDKSKSKALVQLIEDRDIVVRLDFEEICEYTGDAEADLMF